MGRRDILFDGVVECDPEGTWQSTSSVPAFDTTGVFKVQVRALFVGPPDANASSRGIFLHQTIGRELGAPQASVTHHPVEDPPGHVGGSYISFDFVPSTRFFWLQAHDLTVEQFVISVRAISISTTDGLD